MEKSPEELFEILFAQETKRIQYNNYLLCKQYNVENVVDLPKEGHEERLAYNMSRRMYILTQIINADDACIYLPIDSITKYLVKLSQIEIAEFVKKFPNEDKHE